MSKKSGIFKKCVTPNEYTKKITSVDPFSLVTVCPGSSGPFYLVSYYIKWVTTSWTYCSYLFNWSRLIEQTVASYMTNLRNGQDFLAYYILNTLYSPCAWCPGAGERSQSVDSPGHCKRAPYEAFSHSHLADFRGKLAAFLCLN